MRDRTFGVEIECGYSGNSYDGGECRCECSCYTCSYCDYGCDCDASLEPQEGEERQECVCECTCDTCYLCEYGCDGECSEHDDGDCEVAANLLYNNGLGHWCDDIHGDGSGVEIPSPVLRGYEGLRELKQVMELLNANGFAAGRADGLHVHHGADEFAEDERLLATLVELWEENVEHIERLVDPYRRKPTAPYSASGHSWCGRRSDPDAARSSDHWSRFKATKDLKELPGGRYYSLNVSNVNRNYGNSTIEVRLHEGTLDFNKAAAWVHFGQSFLEWAKLMHKRNNIVTCASAGELLRLTRTSQKSKRTLLSVAAA